MAWPASGPGRLLERHGDVAPRRMTVHDRTRLTGRLRRFSRLPGGKSPIVPYRGSGTEQWAPGPLPSTTPRLSARPLDSRGLWLWCGHRGCGACHAQDLAKCTIRGRLRVYEPRVLRGAEIVGAVMSLQRRHPAFVKQTLGPVPVFSHNPAPVDPPLAQAGWVSGGWAPWACALARWTCSGYPHRASAGAARRCENRRPLLPGKPSCPRPS